MNRKSASSQALLNFGKYFIPLVVLAFVSCEPSNTIQTGDLIFVEDTSSDLSQAINDVTKKSGLANYTHVGVCEVVNNEVFIYHASTKKNVVKESLEVFQKDRSNSKIDIFRIEGVNLTQKEKAIETANSFLGMPYDFGYIYGDDKIYCSELIYEIYKKDSLFKLNPMTFKNPQTGAFHKNWVNHYEKLGIAIPEGQPGCNPNDMSKNKNLRFIRTLGSY